MNENQTGVILEEVRGMFKVLAEGQTIIQEDIQNLQDGQKRLEAKVDKLEIRVGNLESGMGRLETRVGNLETSVGRIEKDAKIIKSYMVAVDDGINDYERRITTLEKKTANL